MSRDTVFVNNSNVLPGTLSSQGVILRNIVHIAGQTWLFTIMNFMDNWEKLDKGEVIEKPGMYYTPFMEFFEYPDGNYHFEVAARQQGPRILKTHLPLSYWKDALEKSPKTKVITTIRNPKDTLVSFFHFYRMNRMIGGFHGTWDQFFGMVKDNCVLYGNYFKHTSEWYSFNRSRENSLVLVYEELKNDLRTNVQKLAEFLGRKFPDEIIDKIAERSTFESVVKNPNLTKRGPHIMTERGTFFRKGQVGDWKNYFNEEQNAFVDNKTKEYFGPIGLKFQYE